MRETYAGTRLGRQELDGELIEEIEGALFSRKLLEAVRILRDRSSTGSALPQDERLRDGSSTSSALPQDERFLRIVVGVDPPASTAGTCGIVVCGLGPSPAYAGAGLGAGRADSLLYVLADASVPAATPERWARAVAATAEVWGADRVVAEKNQGGDMVESVLRNASVMLPVRLVSASRGKVARAEPVAALFEAGRAKLAGRFPELEDELAGLLIGGGYSGPGRSPDRADAMVWAMTALMKQRMEPPRIAAL
jgi:phage terminase large subunit-like protein